MDETAFRFQDLPEDILLYTLGFLESHILLAIVRANQRLHALATPVLYRHIVLPNPQHVLANRTTAARLLITLSKNPSLAVFIQSMENAPPTIPPALIYSIPPETISRARVPGLTASEQVEVPQTSLNNPMRFCVNMRSLKVQTPIQANGVHEDGGWLNFLLEPGIKLKKLTLLVKPHPSGVPAWNRFLARVLDHQTSLEYLDYTGFFPENDHAAQQGTSGEMDTKPAYPKG
ncbi:hypothetical protein FRC00_011627 [Tulasnella sp. 408]|nr:hypothetical protein FRC00_011627 [Tulasnella sp. 408]